MNYDKDVCSGSDYIFFNLFIFDVHVSKLKEERAKFNEIRKKWKLFHRRMTEPAHHVKNTYLPSRLLCVNGKVMTSIHHGNGMEHQISIKKGKQTRKSLRIASYGIQWETVVVSRARWITLIVYLILLGCVLGKNKKKTTEIKFISRNLVEGGDVYLESHENLLKKKLK